MNKTYSDNLKSNEHKFMIEKLYHIFLYENIFPELREVAHTPSKVMAG